MRMTMKLSVLLVGAALVWTAPLAAHHAVGAEYDPSKPVKLTGKVSKVEFTNPHGRLFVDVAGEDGKVVTWNAELNARSILVRQGWTAKSVAIGETVTIEGIRARTGVAGVHAQSITKADGSKVFVGDIY